MPAIGAAFALIAYFGFAQTLGINIGAGLVEIAIERLLGSSRRSDMDAFSQLLNGFAVALTPINLVWCLVGTTLGTAIGVLPGLGPALTIALLLPITFKVEPTAAFILFAGIYYGAMYGGSTTSILLNTPGESATIVTALEGNKMARSGRAGAALATAAIGSFVAGTIGTLGITFLAPIVVDLALKFGPADYFSLMVLAFVTVSAVLGSSAVRGLTALFFGIWLGLIGVDLQTGQARFTFGLPSCSTASMSSWWRSACSRSARRSTSPRAIASARTRSSRSRLALDDARGMEALVEAVAARHRVRLSDRRDARGRRRDSDLPELLHRDASSPRNPRSSARARSKASPARRPPTTPRPPACWCRC